MNAVNVHTGKRYKVVSIDLVDNGQFVDSVYVLEPEVKDAICSETIRVNTSYIHHWRVS